MIKNRERKLKISFQSLTYRLALDDRINNLKEIVGILKKKYPNITWQHAMLNTSPESIIDFIIIGKLINPKAPEESLKEQYMILFPPFMSSTGLHSFNLIKGYGPEMISNYFHDLEMDRILIPIEIFNDWLESLNCHMKSEKEIDPETKKPLLIKGLSANKDAENYFAGECGLPLFMSHIELLKSEYDAARSMITRG